MGRSSQTVSWTVFITVQQLCVQHEEGAARRQHREAPQSDACAWSGVPRKLVMVTIAAANTVRTGLPPSQNLVISLSHTLKELFQNHPQRHPRAYATFQVLKQPR